MTSVHYLKCSPLQAFINNFQEAKKAVAEVTQQAAEKAASGVVKELSERSTRISLNVHFKAPVIFVPQSSSSPNVLVADLGFLSVKNHFAKQPSKSYRKLPPVVDIMEVKLTDLKMYRYDSTYAFFNTFLGWGAQRGSKLKHFYHIFYPA